MVVACRVILGLRRPSSAATRLPAAAGRACRSLRLAKGFAVREPTGRLLPRDTTLRKRILLCSGLILVLMSIPASGKVQCSCPKIAADGEGQTSCSASESGGRCTIDFNLFGQASEKRAADLIRRHGERPKLKPPNPELAPDAALRELSLQGGDALIDAVLVYMTVAAGNQSAREPKSVPLGDLQELVKAIGTVPLAKRIEQAFNQQALQQWANRSPQAKIPPEPDQRFTISPGCVEFTSSGGLWLMFKTAWSPARIFPRCGNPSK